MNMILLKYVFCVCMDPLRTPHDRTKKEKEKQKPISIRLYAMDQIFQRFFFFFF